MAARPTLLVGIPLAIALTALDVPALHDIDVGWAGSAIGGAIAGMLGALFGATWFGDRSDLSAYGVQRFGMLLVVVLLAAAGVYFLFEWPPLASVATGTSIALVLAMVLMAASGNL